MRFTDIVTEMGRSDSVVYRVTRGMKRKRPPPPGGKHAKRNDRILRLVMKGLTRAEVGERVGLMASQVGYVVAHHPHVVWLLRVRKLRPATVAKRYRLELSTAERIAQGATSKQVRRSSVRVW